MEALQTNIEDIIGKNDKVIDIWGRRTPRFEKKYEFSVLRKITDYGVGASEHTTDKGKVLGSGYEALILAFFIGLYSNKKFALSDDSSEIKEKGCGQPIDKWGNLDSKSNRHAYSGLRSYIFMALVAKTDVDWIAVDRGDIKVSSAISKMMETMEEYINYGLYIMEDKLNEDKSYFFSNRSFLDMFLQLTDKEEKEEGPVDKPEEL